MKKKPITDPRGQWAYPGEVTRIPGSNITMKGVSYPVLAKASNGMQVIMFPGGEYTFPGASHVDEYPMMQQGGAMTLEKANLEAKRFAKSWGLANAENVYVDKIPQYIDAVTGKPYVGPAVKPLPMTLPSYVSINDVQTDGTRYWYTDPRSSDLVDVDPRAVRGKKTLQNGGYIGNDGKWHKATGSTWAGNTFYKDGGGIHIKLENRGKFTEYKKRTGKTTEEALHSKNPHVRKMAQFAVNAAKWKHQDGGGIGIEGPSFAPNAVNVVNGAQYAWEDFGDTKQVTPKKNIWKSIGKTADTVNTALNIATPILGTLDARRQSKAMEKAYRESLVSMGPVDYSQNRGDWEINTGMVDPYNTGAKSKGMFAGPYYVPEFQYGGVSSGPLSFGNEDVRSNVYQYAGDYPESVASAKPTPAAAPSRTESAPITMELNADFKQYAQKAEKYIKKINPNTDITGEMLAAGAQQTYQKTGQIVPIELVLAQLQTEGYLAKGSGKNKPQRTKNPFNVGNTDDGSVVQHGQLQSGINSYFNLMADQYLKKRTAEQLLQNFVNTAGHRYATDPNYENTLKKLIKNMQGKLQNGGSFISETGPVDMMAYGGQLGYGFDLGGRRVYTDMPESNSESVTNHIGPVPESMATIEAEKGETILTDVDDDGMKEHMIIGGKRHADGGTPLAANPGDFVFSDTKKMAIKNPTLLALFNKTPKKGGVTPAAIAKQYDINKYKAVLQDDNADAISKKTAEMMIDNYNKKLAMLSLVQEAQKGFPNGIPAVSESIMPEAKFGGYLQQYQSKGEVTPTKVRKSEIPGYEKQGYKRLGTSKVWQLDQQNVEQVDPTKGQTTTKTVPGKKYVPNENAWWRSLTPEQKAAHNAKVREMIRTNPEYQPSTQSVTTPDTCPEGYALNPTTGKCEKVTTATKQITYDEGNDLQVPTFTPTDQSTPYGWTQQDINNAFLALKKRGNIHKYGSVRPDMPVVMPDFRNMDWRGKAAELQGNYNSTIGTMGVYGPSQSFAANASFMAGQQAENLDRAISETEQANVQGYNAVSAQRAAFMNQALAQAAQNKFLRSQDRAVLNQNYDNAVNQADSALVQAVNQGLTNAAGIFNTNATEGQYFHIDPFTQKVVFDSNNAKAAFQAAKKGAGPSDSDQLAQYMALRSRLTGVPEDKKDEIVMSMMGLKGGSKSTTTTYPYNPSQNRTTNQVAGPYTYQNPYIGE